MRNEHCRPWNMMKKLKNFEKWKTHPIGLEIWRETFKNVKNKKNPLARKPNNEKNETQTLYDLEYCEKHWKKVENAKYTRCLWLILEVFHFPRHNPDPTVYISHFRRFSIFLPYSRSYTCAVLIFQVFEYFFAIFQVL